MAATKLSTDVIDLSTNTEGLVIPSGVTGPDTADTTIDCNYPTTATSLYQLNGDGGVSNNVPDKCGTYNGTSTNVTYATGKFGNAASFNGSSSFIDLNSKDMYSQQSQITLSAWAYFDNLNTNNYIFSGTTDFGFYDYGNGYIYFLPDSTVTNRGYYQVNGLYTANSWVHIVMVFDGTATGNSNRLKAYINGVKLVLPIYGTIPSTTQTATSNLLIGKSTTRNTYFDGLIDQARIFPSALTQEDVTKLYNETNVTTTSGRPTSPTEGLLRDNTTTGALEFYDGSLWQQISGTLVPGFIASENFNTRLYTGTGANTVVTGVGFAPEFIWIKNTGAITEHIASDIVRGTLNEVSPNNTYKAELRGIAGFDSDGFTLDSVSTANYSSGNLVSWNWKAGGSAVSNNQGSITTQVSVNQDAGFSIVKYTGTGNSTSTIGHGITAGAPDIIICKDTTNAGTSWPVYSSALPAVTNNLFLNLNTTTSQYQNRFSAVTSTTFSSGTSGGEVNGNGATMIAYCWKSVPGYSKISSYVGTGSTGNAQDIGFEPAFLMCKRYSSNSGWYIIDNKRSTSNPRNLFLEANEISAQYTPGDGVNFTPTGFSFINTDLNGGGQNWLYMAFSK